MIYVKGNIKKWHTKTYFEATNLRPSTDPHEVYFHTMATIFSSFALQNGPVRIPDFLWTYNQSSDLLQPNGPGDVHPQAIAPPAIDSHPATDAPSTMNNPFTIESPSLMHGDYEHLPALQQEILEYVRTQQASDQGVHREGITRSVQGLEVTDVEIRYAIISERLHFIAWKSVF